MVVEIHHRVWVGFQHLVSRACVSIQGKCQSRTIEEFTMTSYGSANRSIQKAKGHDEHREFRHNELGGVLNCNSYVSKEDLICLDLNRSEFKSRLDLI